MLGYALRKIAKEYGLTIDDGIAYGDYKGFAVTLSEGMGSKTFCFTGRFPSEAAELAVKRFIEDMDWEKNRIEEVAVNHMGVHIVFFDNPGTMACINRVLEQLIPVLGEAGFVSADHCACCGQPIGADGVWHTETGNAFHIHEHCHEALMKEFADFDAEAHEEEQSALEEEAAKEESKNGYGSGLKGALIGGVLCALITAASFAFLENAFIGGIFGGFVVMWFYGKFCDRNSFTGALMVLGVSVVFLAIGLVVGDLIYYGMQISNGELVISYGELFSYWIAVVSEQNYFVKEFLWGCFAVFLAVDTLFIRAFMYNRRHQ